MLQDAWLRWHANDKTQIQSCEAWLVSVVTRLAIDRLRTSKADRETYVGWWLPEPLVELDENIPESAVELASDVSFAFMWALERLSADERAALLMRHVFDADYAEIAEVLGKSEATCRQCGCARSVRASRCPGMRTASCWRNLTRPPAKASARRCAP